MPPVPNATDDASVPLKVNVLLTVRVFVSPITIDALLVVPIVLIATLLIDVAVATPNIGVTNVGLVSTTILLPVPVWLAITVALPVDVITPVKFALVVTVAAFPSILTPVNVCANDDLLIAIDVVPI